MEDDLPLRKPGDDVEQLLRHADPTVRLCGIRLTAHFDMAFLRPLLVSLAEDPDNEVRLHIGWALSRLAPDGGRGSEIFQTHNGYLGLKAHQAAEIAYDATFVFCNRFIGDRSRTHDQMVQSARSGKQNIVEGSAAAATSSKTELFLTGVARSSLEELLADYQDFLRQRQLPQWPKDDPRTLEVRKLAYAENRSYSLYKSYFEEGSPETAANVGICLVCQASYLIDRLKKKMEQDFLENGGMRERMFQARMKRKTEQERGGG